ncbi:hypothetical protein ACFLYQ_05290 [Chloroflexota bacterium]
MPGTIDKGNPKLDSQLNQLCDADEAGEVVSFAEQHGIELTDEKVRVIIECLEGQLETVSDAVTVAGGNVELTYNNLLQAVIPVSALQRLTEESGIRLIRLPMEMIPGTGSE